MSITRSERRLIENQAVFRKHNEKVQAGLDRVKRLAKEEGHHELARHDDLQLHFYCECSDEDCDKRIVMDSDRYRKIHSNRQRFIVLPGHEVSDVERVVSSSDDYAVVEKFHSPPEDVSRLHQTEVKNI